MKGLRNFFSRYGLRLTVSFVLVLIALLQALGMFQTDLLYRADQVIYDKRMALMPAKLDKRIVILDIDEKSLTEVGRWPWGRNVTAQLVDHLFDHYQIRALAFDVMFSEPDTSSGYATLASLVDRELKDVPEINRKLQSLKPALDYDGLLAKSLKKRPIVLGFTLSEELKKGQAPAPAFTAGELGGNPVAAYEAKAYLGNLAPLQQAARAGGFINTNFDEDGLLRATPLMMRVGDDYYESLSLATVRLALGADKVVPVFNTDAGLRDLGILQALMLGGSAGELMVPVESLTNVRIQYRGHGGPDGGTFRYVSAVDVLKDRTPPEILKNAIVLVGTNAPALKDLRATPVSSEYPGVEVHANLIASMLDGTFKQQPDYGPGLNFVQICLIGLLLMIILAVASPQVSILCSLLAAAAVVALNSWLYFSKDAIVPMAPVLILIASLFIFNVAWGYLFEHRKGRAMVNLFGEYVAPELVAEMAQNPQNYSMEGESRELTVLFADVRGFTTISESLEPNALREFINIYLTAMSEDIRGNRGTLDKYIGDAVMAFWGAPISFPDHAARAVATALTMQASAKRLNAEFIARGWPELKIGVGLNTGEMRVGDMGSKIRRAYTVMGDAVNLASRLEGITKVYGVGVVVGESTRAAAPEFAYRELDRVRVKGKNEPVAIFEPLGLLSELPADMLARIEQWHQALALVRAQQWDQAETTIEALRQHEPDHELYRLYLRNITHHRLNPPGPDWDGVTTFETK